MADVPRECKHNRKLLVEYALGTLSEWKRDSMTAHIDTCAGCNAELEAHRAAIGELDSMEAETPGRNLASSVMQMIEAAEGPSAKPAARKRRLFSGALDFVAVAAILVIVAAVLLPTLNQSREASRQASSANNLKQIGLSFKMYSNEDKDGKFPPVTRYEGLWIPDLKALHPEYLSDLSVLVNPGLPDAKKLTEELEKEVNKSQPDWEYISRILAKSYVYTGWTVQDEADARAVVKARSQIVDAKYDEDISAGLSKLYRIRKGIERFFLTDINNPSGSATAQSGIVVMFEHVSGESGRVEGINVLYMDGHVDFVHFGEAFPASGAVGKLFEAPDSKD